MGQFVLMRKVADDIEWAILAHLTIASIETNCR